MRTGRCPERLRRIAADERGWTLIELVIVCMVSIIVVGIPLTLAMNAVVSQNNATSRSAATSRVEVGVKRLLSDVRGATHATFTATTATLTVPNRMASGGTPTTQTVTWTCTVGASCTRAATGGTFPMIQDVVAATFAPVAADGTALLIDPVYVSFTVSVRNSSEQVDHTRTIASGSTPVTVTDGAALRNLAL
jgi:type II secretory pathway pseudopilin PulG